MSPPAEKALSKSRWAAIQAGEFDYHAAKDETRVLERNLPYWRSLLSVLPAEVKLDADGSYLDLGCGGCGILLALEGGRRVGVDPLMDRYLEKFPYLSEQAGAEWIRGTAEEVEVVGPFDVVFTINSFDHVFDPKRAVANIVKHLRPGGHVVMTMNSHNTAFFRNYYSRMYRVIDQHHPFQFSPEDIQELFGGLTPVTVRDVDDLWFEHAEAYYRDVLHRGVEDRRKWLRGALNPFKWPMGFCKFVLDMPPHRKRSGQRSIYSNFLFVFRLDAAR